MSLSSVCEIPELSQIILSNLNDKRPFAIVFGKSLSRFIIYSFVFSIDLFETYTIGELLYLPALIKRITDIDISNAMLCENGLNESISRISESNNPICIDFCKKNILWIEAEFSLVKKSLANNENKFMKHTIELYQSVASQLASIFLGKKVLYTMKKDPSLWILFFITFIFKLLSH